MDRVRVDSTTPRVTVRKAGQLVLTEAAVAMLGEGVEHVQIGYNAKSRVVGIRPAADGVRGTLKLRAQPNGRSRLVDAKRFFAHRSLNLEIVEGLGRIGATAAEMAYVLPAGRSTIEHRMADPESDFHNAYKKGQSLLKASLRRKQIAVAMAGNVTMLIWLGKQHLAQQDRVTVDSTEVKAILDKLVAAADEARDVGDHAGMAAILAAIDRIGDGEPAEAVYLEWLRAQRSRATGDGSATGR